MSDLFPACNVVFPEPETYHGAAFYLAAEEFLAREFPLNNYFFTWRVNPTCVFGRNQDPRVELDLDFCEKHGVDIVRRRSGGGAIFADSNNLMLSLVTGTGCVETLFRDFAQGIADALLSMGVPARVSGRNDVVLEDGRKVCGGAFYRLKERSIIHSTMLYDTAWELMSRCLTPRRAKLESKGVVSVESRVGVLKDFLPQGIEHLQRDLLSLLTNRHVQLSDNDILCIQEIEKNYHHKHYIYRNNKNSATPGIVFSKHLQGCGMIEMKIFCNDDGQVLHITLSGDYFDSSSTPAQDVFLKALQGLKISPSNRLDQAVIIRQALLDSKAYLSIRNLTEEALIEFFSVDNLKT